MTHHWNNEAVHRRWSAPAGPKRPPPGGSGRHLRADRLHHRHRRGQGGPGEPGRVARGRGFPVGDLRRRQSARVGRLVMEEFEPQRHRDTEKTRREERRRKKEECRRVGPCLPCFYPRFSSLLCVSVSLWFNLFEGASMKRVIITVGLGFGDEGKGAAVDYLTRRMKPHSWFATAAAARPGTTYSSPTAAGTPFRSSAPAPWPGPQSRCERTLAPTSSLIRRPCSARPSTSRNWKSAAQRAFSPSTPDAWSPPSGTGRQSAAGNGRGEDKHGSCGQGSARPAATGLHMARTPFSRRTSATWTSCTTNSNSSARGPSWKCKTSFPASTVPCARSTSGMDHGIGRPQSQ